MTKRLFAYSGITMLCTYAAVFYFEFWGALTACAAAVIAFAAAFLYRGPHRNKSACIFVSFVILLSLSAYNLYDRGFESSINKYDGRTASISATAIENVYENYGSYCYELKTDKIDGESESIKLLLQTDYDIGLEYGDKIEARVLLESPSAGYYKSRGFVCRAFSEDFDLDCKITKVGDKGLRYLPIKLRESLTRSLRHLMPGVEGELCAAATFGVRSELNKDVYNLISDSGLSFFIVVSGLHVSIIAMAILLLLAPLKRNARLNPLRCVAATAAVLIYMAITGFTPSVVRSGIMIILTIVGSAAFRQSDSRNNMGLAAFVLTVFNPYAVGDAGLLLSFASVFGILWLRPRIAGRLFAAADAGYQRSARLLWATNIRSRIIGLSIRMAFNRALRAFFNVFSVSLSATAAIIPVALLLFGTANPFVIMFGVFLSPFITVMVSSSMIAAFCCFVPFLCCASGFFAFVASVCGNIFLKCAGAAGDAVGWTLYTDRDIILAVFVFSAASAAVLLLIKKKLNLAVPALTAVALLLVCCVAVRYFHSSSLELRLLSAGRGTAVQLSGSGAEAVLGFCGKPTSDSAFLEKLRRRAGGVNTLMITDDSIETCRAGSSILNEFDVSTILLYHSDRTARDLADRAPNVENYIESEGQENVILNLGDGITDTVINTGKYVWHYLKADNRTALICLRGGHADALDSRFRRADYLIAGGDLADPENIECSRCIRLDVGEAPEGFENAENVFGEDCYIKLK